MVSLLLPYGAFFTAGAAAIEGMCGLIAMQPAKVNNGENAITTE